MEHMKKLEDKNLRQELGLNGNKYMLNNYTSKHAYKIIMKHFNEKE
jgi:hypothetical protein